MSIKKRFSISADLASGLRHTIQSASSNHGQLHYDMMPLEMIEPDPENPRRLMITRQELLSGLNPQDPHYTHKQKELDSLQELAESIKRVGIRNALEVYKEGSIYRLISGERRYLAAWLAQQHTVPTRINPKPDEFKLRYTQWVENINRQDLSLWEKYNNLLSIASAYQKTHQLKIDEKALQELIGLSPMQSYRYFCLLNAESAIIQLIQKGKLNNLKIVQELMTMKDKGLREEILAWLATSTEELTSLARYKKALPFPVIANSGTSINFGKIKNPAIAKHLLQLILTHPALNQLPLKEEAIDWTSPKAVEKAFKEVVKFLAKALKANETHA